MESYPLVVRNNVPLMLRGLVGIWLGGVALITYIALRDGPPEPHKWWPLTMLIFWTAGLFFMIHVLNLEAARVTITGARSIHVSRGPAFRREELWTDHARFWIAEEEDSDGAPYFKLLMDAPGGKLVINECHSRQRLEALQQRLEAAIAGR